MTRKDLVRSVADGLDVDQKQAQTIVQRVLDTVLATLATQGRVELRNFGVFEVKRRAARKAHNPRTGEKVDVPERHVVTFKPGREMQQRIEARANSQHDLDSTRLFPSYDHRRFVLVVCSIGLPSSLR